MARPTPYKPRPFVAYQRDLQNNQLARGSDLTDFQPGSRLSTITDGLALTLARRDMETYNGFLNAIQEATYTAFGFPRKPGVPASGVVRIDHSGHTELLTFGPFEIELFGQRFRSLNSTILPVGETFTSVEVLAVDAGQAGNIQRSAIDTAAGKGSINIAIPAEARIWNPAAFSGGTDQESPEARKARFQAYIRSFGRSNRQGIEAGALSVPGVVGATVTRNINPYSHEPETGWVNVYITDGSAQPPAALIAEVKRTIEGVSGDENYPGYAADGVNVFVGAIMVYAVNVSYRLTLIQGSSLSDSEAIELANDAAMTYVNRLPLGQDVLPQTIAAQILSADPDFFRVEVTTPATDEVVPESALPRIGGAGGGVIDGLVVGREQPG